MVTIYEMIMATPKQKISPVAKTIGRPRKYTTPEALETAINKYFESCEQEGKFPTVSGLSLALGFNSRQSLYNYRNTEEFLDIIQKALTIVEMHYEEQLFTPHCR